MLKIPPQRIELMSTAEKVSLLTPEERSKLFETYTEEQMEWLQYDTDFWLRPSQKINMDADWFITALIAGRGFGKTLTMSHWVKKMALENPGCRIAVAGKTAQEVRRVMVQGESGILAVHHPSERPEYKQYTASIHWENGSLVELHTAETPDSARGPQYHYTVMDEFAAWKTAVDTSGATLYTNLIAATRLGDHPRMLLATTPRKSPAMKDIIDKSKDPEQGVVIIGGSTFENSTLSKTYVKNLVNQYGNSQLAEQELNGVMLEDASGIVFTDELLQKALFNYALEEKPKRYPMRFIAVDPSVSADPSNSDECGIVAIGSTIESDLTRRTAYILEDGSLRAGPEEWTKEVKRLADKYKTRFVVVEKNQGGDLLRLALNAVDPTLKVYPVTATKGKRKRAEPVVIAMQQGRVRLMDEFPELRDQLLFYDPEDSSYSPDRMDAAVWGVIAALIDPPEGLRPGMTKSMSAGSRKLPTGMGTGRQRYTSSIRGKANRL